MEIDDEYLVWPERNLTFPLMVETFGARGVSHPRGDVVLPGRQYYEMLMDP